MSGEHAEVVIPATPDEVRGVLLDPLALPAWNPAFYTVSGPTQAAIGVQYRIRVRPGLTGVAEYTTITPNRIGLAWNVPGFREVGSWTFEPRGAGTFARHEFQQSGPLATALRPAHRGVAGLRMERLAQYLLLTPLHPVVRPEDR
ncbi:MAG: SRPBCC family protein [Jiangellaceae bacterium]